MQNLGVVGLYAAGLAILFVTLSIRTIRLRRRLQVAIGDGGEAELTRAMRVHANFAEYVPFALLLITLVALTGGPPALVHGLGAALVIGRLLHAWGVSQTQETFAFRVTGMALTFTTLLVAAAVLLVAAVTDRVGG